MADLLVCEKRQSLESDDPALQTHLEQHYSAFKGKPVLCLCTDLRVRMYIARFQDRLLLKRWPGSGPEHAPACDRYEAPFDTSGLGKLLGSAIREDTITGQVELRLGFPMRKQPRSKAAAEADAGVDSSELEEVDGKASSTRVSLRATLHYLWDQAELTHWKPGMKGKRNWWVVQRRLTDVAQTILVKGKALGNRLLIPEPFQMDMKDDIRLRRRALLQSVASAKPARELLMFLIELKELSPSAYGYRIIAKNAPDEPFYLSAELFKQLRKRFDTELEMFEAGGPGHLIGLGTLSVKPSGTITVEEMTLMMTSAEWLPVSDGRESIIVDYCVATGRRFIKPLKYSMAPGRPIAAILLTDPPELPTALYISAPDDSEALIASRQELLQSTHSRSVIWDVSEDPLPTSLIDSIPSGRSP